MLLVCLGVVCGMGVVLVVGIREVMWGKLDRWLMIGWWMMCVCVVSGFVCLCCCILMLCIILCVG